MAADLKYQVQVDTTQAQRSLDNLKNKVETLSGVFDKLRSAVAGIAFGSLVANALQYADAIQDIADATGIATAEVLGFSQVVALNGGSAEGAQKAILKLATAIDEAAGGSKEAQMSFIKVGISLKDLASLSEKDILAKTIKGLAGVKDASERIALAQKLLGKEFRSVNLEEVAKGYAGATIESARYANAIEAAARTQNKIDETMNNFKVALLAVLEPIADVASKLSISIDAMKRFIEAGIAIAAVVASFYAVARVVKIVWGALLLIPEALSAIGTTATVVLNFFRQPLLVIKELFSSWRVAVVLVEEAIVKLGPAAKVIGGILATLAGVFTYMSDGIGNAIDRIKEFIGIANKGDPRRAWRDQEIKDAEELKKKEEERQKIQRQIKTDLDAFRLTQAQVISDYDNANVAVLQRLRLETNLIGKSEDQIEIERAREEVLNRQRSIIQDLQKQQDKLRLTLDTDPTAAAKIEAINETIRRMWRETSLAQDQVQGYIEKMQGARLIEQDRINTLKQLEERMQKQADIQAELTKNYQDYQQQLTQAQREGAQLTMGPTEKAMANIKNQMDDAALAAKRAFAAMFEGQDLTAAQSQQLADGLAKIDERFKQIGDTQTRNLEKSREWGTGWENAFNAYKDSAQNAAEQASTYFNTFTRGFEDAIVKFVQTGKLSFKDLANNIIADFVRIQAKQIALGLFGGDKGGGLLGSIFGGLTGKAVGGPVSANTPYIVGERGPELFMPRSAGTIVPNNQLGMGGTSNTQVTYNIQAVDAASFRQMVARDPEFLHAVVERGRNSIPGGRR